MLSHWQRVMAYLTWCLVIGLALVLFTHKFFKFADASGSTGYLTLFGFAVALLNLSFVVNGRFTMKSHHHQALNYLFSFMMVAPTLLWIFTKDTGLGDALLTFTLTIVFAAFVGTFFGIRRGFSKREAYWAKQTTYDEDRMPDELKRPHDKLSNN